MIAYSVKDKNQQDKDTHGIESTRKETWAKKVLNTL